MAPAQLPQGPPMSVEEAVVVLQVCVLDGRGGVGVGVGVGARGGWPGGEAALAVAKTSAAAPPRPKRPGLLQPCHAMRALRRTGTGRASRLASCRLLTAPRCRHRRRTSRRHAQQQASLRLPRWQQAERCWPARPPLRAHPAHTSSGVLMEAGHSRASCGCGGTADSPPLPLPRVRRPTSAEGRPARMRSGCASPRRSVRWRSGAAGRACR
jgi:hypothetical protein